MKETVFILWTGGWDSTYRLIELSMKEIIIQAVYVEDPDRIGVPYELKAMEKIISLLNKKERTRATILPLKVIKKSDISKDHVISEAYHRLSETIKLGSQYEWLSRLAKEYPGIETGCERQSAEYEGGNFIVDEKLGALVFKNGSWIVDRTRSTRDQVILFENFSFPIISLTEKEMREKIHNWGYEDVMKEIWFCHNPIHGAACGFCRPCQQKIEYGMELLLPVKGLRRYRWFILLTNLFGNSLGLKIANVLFRKIAIY